MTDREHEAKLKALFEDSALAADPMARARMQARAREIPERARSPFSRAWLVAAALLGAGALVFGLGRAGHERQLTQSALLLARSSAERARKPVSVSNRAPIPAAETQTRPAEVDESANLSEFDEGSVFDDLAFDPGDLPDAELESWIAAAKDQEGG